MSAFGGKADMALCGNSLSRSLLGVKRTWLVAAHMSAFDPKRTRKPRKCYPCRLSHRENDADENDGRTQDVRSGREGLGRDSKVWSVARLVPDHLNLRG